MTKQSLGTSISMSVDFLLCEDDTALQNRTTDPQKKTSSSQNVQTAVIWTADSDQNY